MIDSFAKLNIGAMLRLSAIPEDIDPLDRQVAILAVLSDCTEDEILALPLDDYARRVAASRFLDNDMPTRLPQRSYKCGDFVLVPVRDMAKITTAQFIDFKAYTDRAQGDKRRLSGLTVELLSCMLVPQDCDYCDGYDPQEVQEAIRDHMRADDALALSAFFLTRWMRSSRRILASSRRTARRLKMDMTLEKIRTLRQMRKALLTTSPRAGAGTR